jgi:PAS domain S-box-containing protein
MACPPQQESPGPEDDRSPEWSVPSFEFIVEAINEGVLLCDLHGRLLYVNHRMAEMLGYRPDEMVGAMLFDFMSPDWAEQARRNLKRRARGLAEVFEHEFRHQDGYSLQTLVASRPIRVTQDEYEASLVAITDISERARAVEQLRLSEESFRTLTESSPEGIIIHRNGRIIYANPAIATLLGYADPAELCGLSVETLVPDQDLAPLVKRVAKIDSQAAITPFEEHQLRRKNGVHISVETAHYEGTYAGKPAIISLLRDITQRKELQAKTMQLDRVLVAGTLAAGIGHEVNNPLAFMSGHLDFARGEIDDCLALLDDSQADDTDAQMKAANLRDVIDTLREVRHSLEVASRGSARIRDIVENLRLFTREEFEPPYAVDVVESLEAAIQMLGNQLPSGTRIVRRFEAVPPVMGYESGLGQVLLNLLINAAQAMDEAGPDEHLLELSVSQDEDEVVVEVEDTGVGIDPEQIERIFDPFFTTKAPDTGTGLGLTISKKLVERMGGALEICSREPTGAHVTLRLSPAPQH